MECAGSVRAREVSRKVAGRSAPAFCSRTGWRREVRQSLSAVRRRRRLPAPHRNAVPDPFESNRESADYPPRPATAPFLRHAESCTFCGADNSLSPILAFVVLHYAKIIAALSAGFFQQKEFTDLNAFIERFAHVVDRQGGGSGGDQSFHFHAGLCGGGHLSANLHAIFAHAGVHINVSERQLVTKKYPL